MSEHTPPPWTAVCDDERECWVVTDRQPGGSQSHDGDGANEHIADVFDPANAHLVIAAPVLLAELENIVRANPRDWDEDLRGDFQQWAQSRARAAIAKAKGDPQ